MQNADQSPLRHQSRELRVARFQEKLNFLLANFRFCRASMKGRRTLNESIADLNSLQFGERGMTAARELAFPIVQWGDDYIFVASSYKELMPTARSMFEPLRQEAQSGRVRLLDSSGNLFDVIDLQIISGATFFDRMIRGFNTEPILANERQLELEDFKQYVRKAVNARQRYDRGSYILQDTMTKLPQARSYREAIEAIPEIY